ncbi:hypothetical protein LAZ67_10001151 [Cordylochernes scorpioides]|uniref:Reverse transcriptase n=1 Tax=Cordylochernes scorpioides TaxID=51811 RepID=A0ABY6L0J9_9ARAC|nr:hypothetical protein LAZ67_10001151 [Cordylochernes scorpioides]
MHVKGEDNPADLASRGNSLDQFLDLELCWHGPPWLKTTSQPYNDSIPVINAQCLSEKRIKTNLFVRGNISYSFITRYSSFNKLKRIRGWIFRFFYNCRKPLKKEKSGELSLEEIETSFNRIIRCVQKKGLLHRFETIRGLTTFKWEKHYHDRLLHAGVQLILSAIWVKYWIPSERCLVKQILFKCIKCARFRTKLVHQLMGNLPDSAARRLI